MTRAFDTELLFQSYPDFVGENFAPSQIKKFRAETKSWLNTLPLYEYAYVLMHYTAHHLGGDNPTQYLSILFNQMLMPIVAAYLKTLTFYRFKRAAEMRRYYSCKKICAPEGHVAMKTKFGMCTCRTKTILRHICQDYKWIRALPDDHYKVTGMIKVCQDIAAKFEKTLDVRLADYSEEIAKLELEKQEESTPPEQPETPTSEE